jgi:hypothetical protein
MPLSLKAYMAGWLAASGAALALYLRERGSYAFSHCAYWRFLLVPWKAVIFAVAAAGITFMAPYTDDPTWDYYNAFGMSVLTFTTAPWAIGALYRSVHRLLPVRQAFVALSLMFFSSSWSYDLYLLLRDGDYPSTWLPNLYASSFVYILAGLLWSLDWREGRGVLFAFMDKEWPAPPNPAASRKVLWFALPIILIVAALFLQFLRPMK